MYLRLLPNTIDNTILICDHNIYLVANFYIMPVSRLLPRFTACTSRTVRAHKACVIAIAQTSSRPFSNSFQRSSPAQSGSEPPDAPANDGADAPFLASSKRLPEFSLKGKVILVSGGAQGLGLTQAEALLEAGATGE